MYTSPAKRVLGSGLCGLKNMGNTCYVNGIMQCSLSFPIVLGGLQLVHLDEYASVTHPLTCALRIFLEELQHSSSSYSYDVFLECLQSNWLRFKPKTQQDLMEFFTFLISRVHGEILEKHFTGDKRRIDPDDVDVSVLDIWMSSEMSKMTYMFGLQTVRLSICSACGTESGICDAPEMFLSLALPEGKTTCTLQECLELFRTVSYNTCSTCGEDSARSHLTFGRLPPILVVHLVRFSGTDNNNYIKNTCKVSYDQTIDLKEFTLKDLQTDTKWYHFDDAYVSASSTRRALPETAYILWYQQKVEVKTNSTLLDSLSESVLRCQFPPNPVPADASPKGMEDERSSSPLSPETASPPPVLSSDLAPQAMDGEVNIPFCPKTSPPSPAGHVSPPPPADSITVPQDRRVPKLIIKFTALVSKDSEDNQSEKYIEWSKPESTFIQPAPPKRRKIGLDDEDPLIKKGDIPGANLDISKIGDARRPQLEKWLKTHGLPITGKTDELIHR
ncbi:putative ubiquitin carboxyl-terminal hydrolase 50 [Frankliniella occidentalis]|uniref:ubiquitinyl hydrolase 1 n=1 Tax=Frankliniella occidentalis TaxID=133901 RepID=A0A9C6TN10_FRAOC|nr:putative ubiquitin carboxyl-terminal hydrolase 50 [Frankliniella occidentalis]